MVTQKDIKGYEGLYTISDNGKVFSINSNKFIKQHSDKRGYMNVTLSYKLRKTIRVHRLVAEAFIPNTFNKDTVNHIDGDKTNNSVHNLEWNTQKENAVHAFDTGLRVGRRNNNKLSDEQVKEVRLLIGLGIAQRKIATTFDISQRAVFNIVHNITYKDTK